MSESRQRRQSLCAALVALLALEASSCAFLAARPKSPAREVSYKALNDPIPRGDRYFLLVFGAESAPKLPRFTHSWATFVRVGPTGAGMPPDIEVHSISWMPATLCIRTFRPMVEPGVNLSLHQSVRMAMGYHERISLWGPYEMPSGLYRKLMLQKQYLESGAIGYQCIDTVGESGVTGDGSNCIHAISDGDVLFTRQAYPLTYFGDSASQNILRMLVERRAIPDVKTKHDWLIPLLGLDQYPICRREYTPPLIHGPLRFGPFVPARPGDPGP